jgi:hypothetical protein
MRVSAWEAEHGGGVDSLSLYEHGAGRTAGKQAGTGEKVKPLPPFELHVLKRRRQLFASLSGMSVRRRENGCAFWTGDLRCILIIFYPDNPDNPDNAAGSPVR